MNNALYIDKLTYQELGSRSAKVLTQNALDEKKIAKVLSLISQDKLNLIDAINEDECVSMTIRIDGHKFGLEFLIVLTKLAISMTIYPATKLILLLVGMIIPDGPSAMILN